MCTDTDQEPTMPVPGSERTEIEGLVDRLIRAQTAATNRIQGTATFERLGDLTPDGFTVNDTLRMWVWHFWTHQRELVRARGPLAGDDPHFHVPHYVRQAYEEFGRFIGELSCLSDDYLDVKAPEGGRTVRETVEHLAETLEGYFAAEIEAAKPDESR